MPIRTKSLATTMDASSQYRNLQEKAEEINLVLLQPNVDLWKLRALALSEGGLVNDTLRKRAWPKLVGLSKYQSPEPLRVETINTVASMTSQEKHTPAWSGGSNSPGSSSPFQDQTPQFEIDTALMPSASQGPSTPKTPNNHAPPDLMVQSMDVEQIERDVARCTWHLLTGSQRSRRNQMQHKDQSKKVMGLLKRKQRRLANLINLTLVESYHRQRQAAMDHPITTTATTSHLASPSTNLPSPTKSDQYLRYYQGYHDVACIFLHALGGGQTIPFPSTPVGKVLSLQQQRGEDPLGLDLPATVLCQLSASHFRDSMRQNFMSLQTALKIALYPLLFQFDRDVHNHLQDCDMEPFFCLSWVLTWFSHDIRDTSLCKRLFDALMCGHPLFVLYIALAMMLHPVNRKLILETDCDFASLHQCLASLPRNSCKVGWKGVGGGAYVSDNEEDVHEEHDDGKSANTGFSQNKSYDGVAGSVATTPSSSQTYASGGALGNTSVEEEVGLRVPFQELIDNALTYMKAYPPRSLMKLARRYYRNEQWIIGQDGNRSNITLLQAPPQWSLVSTAPADWVLKQRMRQDMGLKATSRKDRRRKAQAKVSEEAMQALLDPVVDEYYLKTHANDPAVIAVGYGPGPEAVLARKRQRRRLASAVAVGFLAVTVGMLYQQYTYMAPSGSVKAPASALPQKKASFIKTLFDRRRGNGSRGNYASLQGSNSILSTSHSEKTADSNASSLSASLLSSSIAMGSLFQDSSVRKEDVEAISEQTDKLLKAKHSTAPQKKKFSAAGLGQAKSKTSPPSVTLKDSSSFEKQSLANSHHSKSVSIEEEESLSNQNRLAILSPRKIVQWFRKAAAKVIQAALTPLRLFLKHLRQG